MPLNVLLINSSRRWVGEAAHTLNLAKLLHDAGHNVLVGCRRGWDLEKALRDARLPLLPLTLNSHFNPVRDGADCRIIRQEVKKSGIQIVHCHRGKEHWLAFAALVGLKRRVALVRTRHVVVPLRRHWFNRMLFGRFTDGIIGVSQAALGSFGPMLDKVPQQKVTVIHSGVDAQQFNPGNRDEELRREWGVGEGGLAIGLVARFQRIKGQRIFLKAAAEVARVVPESIFVIFGRKVQQNEGQLLRWIDDAGIPRDRIVIETRWLPVERVIGSLDIGVSASLGSEGFSRIAVEYMASEIPVVVTAVGALPEIVVDGEMGHIIPPGNPAILASRLVPLCRDSELRKRMGKASRARVVSYFTPERFLNETVEFYYRILRR